MGLIKEVIVGGVIISGAYISYCAGYNSGQIDYATHQQSKLEERLEGGIDKAAGITKNAIKNIAEFSKKIPEMIQDYRGDKCER